MLLLHTNRLYGWGTLNTNVWLPSLIELVGYDPNHYYDPSGVYYSAMQGLNASTNHWTDPQGGTQFAYFKQYNTSGGGTRIFNVCNQQRSWTRSPLFAYTDRVYSFSHPGGVDHDSVSYSLAVHPAGG